MQLSFVEEVILLIFMCVCVCNLGQIRKNFMQCHVNVSQRHHGQRHHHAALSKASC